jgi:hypothetical protein
VHDGRVDLGAVDNMGAVSLYTGGGAHWNLVGTLLSPTPTYLNSFGGAVDFDGDRVLMGDASYHGAFQYTGRAILVEDLLPGPTVIDLGLGMAGTSGTPALSVTGTPSAGAPLVIEATGAAPSAVAWWILGMAQADKAIKGGVLVPSPDDLVITVTDGLGETSETVPWPAGLPTGFRAALQLWVQDAGGPQGFAASNGVALVGE